MNRIENDAVEEPSAVMPLRECQAALDEGEKPDCGEFLARRAEISDELADCLDGLEYLLAVAAKLSLSDDEPLMTGEPFRRSRHPNRSPP